MRDARIRAVVFARVRAPGLLLREPAASTRRPTFSFWIDEQGGESAVARRRRSASCGSSPASVRWFVGDPPARARGAAFRWRPWLLLLVWPWVAAVLAALLDGKPANLTGMIGGSLELAAPITLGALAGILSERSGMLNIALEGKMLVGRVRRVGRRERRPASSPGTRFIARRDRRRRRRCWSRAASGLLLAWLGIRHKVDQIIAGTVINIGAVGITNFLFLRVLSRNTRVQHAADHRAVAPAVPGRHPGPRPDPLLREAVRVRDVRRWSRSSRT